MLDSIFWSSIEERNFASVLLCSTLFSWSFNHCSCNFFLKEVKLQKAKARYHKTQTLQLSATSNPTLKPIFMTLQQCKLILFPPKPGNQMHLRSLPIKVRAAYATQTLSNIHPDLQCQFPWPSNYSSCNFSSQNWEIVRIWSTRCTHYHEAQDPPVIGNIKPDLHADFRGPPTTLAITFPQKTWEQMDLPTSHANVRTACVWSQR